MGTFRVLKLPLGFIRVLEWVSCNFAVFLPSRMQKLRECKRIRTKTRLIKQEHWDEGQCGASLRSHPGFPGFDLIDSCVLNFYLLPFCCMNVGVASTRGGTWPTVPSPIPRLTPWRNGSSLCNDFQAPWQLRTRGNSLCRFCNRAYLWTRCAIHAHFAPVHQSAPFLLQVRWYNRSHGERSVLAGTQLKLYYLSLSVCLSVWVPSAHSRVYCTAQRRPEAPRRYVICFDVSLEKIL